MIIFFGDIPTDLPKYVKYAPDCETVVEPSFKVSMYTAENYPNEPMASFETDKLFNITAHDKYPRFGGFMKYEGEFEYDDDTDAHTLLDLGRVGETAQVFLNGTPVGERIAPPYRFDVSGIIKRGKNELCVVVTNHLGYEQRDLCAKYLVMEPSGLLGPIEIRKTARVNCDD